MLDQTLIIASAVWIVIARRPNVARARRSNSVQHVAFVGVILTRYGCEARAVAVQQKCARLRSIIIKPSGPNSPVSQCDDRTERTRLAWAGTGHDPPSSSVEVQDERRAACSRSAQPIADRPDVIQPGRGEAVQRIVTVTSVRCDHDRPRISVPTFRQRAINARVIEIITGRPHIVRCRGDNRRKINRHDVGFALGMIDQATPS